MSIFLAGCWDRIDIEERGFVIGTALDLADQKSNEDYEVIMTNQFVIPAGLGSITEGSGGQEAFMNISETGTSLFRTNRKFSQLNSQVPFYQHLKVLLISDEVMKQPNLFSDMMDFYIRDHAMRRSIRLVVAEGEARDILNLKPKNVNVPSMYLDDLMENVDRNTSTIKPVHVGEVQELILNEQSYVLPIVKKAGDQAEYGNVVVINGESNQMVGSLDEEETAGLGFVNGHTEGGVLEIQVDDDLIAIEITEIKQNMNIKNRQKDQLRVGISIDIKGNIAEHFGGRSVLKEQYVNKIEKSAEKKVKELVGNTIEEVQGELNTDVLGIGKTLYKFHYDFWQKIKNDWEKGENYFSSAVIDVNANVEIDRVGSNDRIKMSEGG